MWHTRWEKKNANQEGKNEKAGLREIDDYGTDNVLQEFGCDGKGPKGVADG